MRTLFLDVSVIYRDDAGTGIQRVVRAISNQLMQNPPQGWQIVPVGSTPKRGYHRIGWPEAPLARYEKISASPGDVFLGLDFALKSVYFHEKQLARFSRNGGRLWFVMYDLLPQMKPEWFSDGLVYRYKKWLYILAKHADGFFSISPTVAQDLEHQLTEQFKLNKGYENIVIPMGWDLSQAKFSTEHVASKNPLPPAIQQRPTILMVGTLEPRKGHAQVLEAMEILWQQGQALNLLIVGRPGWKTEDLQQYICSHPEYEKKLHWLSNADDDVLQQGYEESFGIIIASYSEGFGLPLLEALGHGKPVLARDLAVFKTIQSRKIQYFPEKASSHDLAVAIKAWHQSDQYPGPDANLSMPNWKDTTNAIMATLEESRLEQ